MSREVVEVDRLSMSLDAIISHQEKQKKPAATSSLVIRNNTARRSERQDAPYRPKKEKILNYSADIIEGDYCIKFLLTNYLSGIFIGNGGSAIREMMDITHALIHISNLGENYPGTRERVVYIKGTLASVTLAQSLVWEMIGQQAFADKEPTNLGGRRNLNWDPAVAKENPGEYDDVEVENRISIPQSVAGAVIGRSGNGLRELSNDCGISVTIDSKEDGEITHERLITLSGSVAGCMKCTSLILKKLANLREVYSYFYNGSTYPKYVRESNQKPVATSSSDDGHVHRTNRLPNILAAGENGLFDPMAKSIAGAETLSAHTTIELAVPNHLVGAILGPQSSKLGEIIQLSGAKVQVSKWGEYVEGTNNRLVTIVGTPACAQTAHTLIIHRLKQEMSSIAN